MVKKRITKVFAVILTMLLGLSAMGCGSNGQDEASQGDGKSVPENGSGQQQDNSQSEEMKGDSVEGEIVYPLETEDTLTLWSMNQLLPNEEYADYTESPFHMGLEKNTGVKVEWQFPVQGADPTQAYNLLLTEDVLPDIIFKAITPAEANLEDIFK